VSQLKIDSNLLSHGRKSMFSTNVVLILYDLPDRQRKTAEPCLSCSNERFSRRSQDDGTQPNIEYKMNLYPSTAISLQREIKSKKVRDAGLTPPNAPQ
jgi:hypothetical protein